MCRANCDVGDDRPQCGLGHRHVVLLFTGWVLLKLLGYAFLVGQAAFIGDVAELQIVAMSKSAAVVSARS